jgi:sugar-specific transcriptional regulator TrmB
MAKRKSLEDLLDETRKDLEDLITILNELKKEVPTEIREEILLSHRKVEEYTKTLKDTLQEIEHTIEKWDQKAKQLHEEIEDQTDLITEKYFQVLEEIREQIQNLKREIENYINQTLEEIKFSAQAGIEKGIENGISQIKESINQTQKIIEENLTKLVKIIRYLQQELAKAENIFEKYQWSWLGIVILFFLFIALENFVLFGILTNSDKLIEISKTILEIGFLLSATYGVYKLSPKLNEWVTYSIIVLLITTALFIGFTTIKNKIQIVKKEVCNLPEPDKAVPQQDGSICYFYNGWYLGKDGKYHRGQVVICK